VAKAAGQVFSAGSWSRACTSQVGRRLATDARPSALAGLGCTIKLSEARCGVSQQQRGPAQDMIARWFSRVARMAGGCGDWAWLCDPSDGPMRRYAE